MLDINKMLKEIETLPNQHPQIQNNHHTKEFLSKSKQDIKRSLLLDLDAVDEDLLLKQVYGFIGIKQKYWKNYIEIKAWETINKYELLDNVFPWITIYSHYKYNPKTNKSYILVMFERMLYKLSKIINLVSIREFGYVYIFMYSFINKKYITNTILRNQILSYKLVMAMNKPTSGNIKAMLKTLLDNASDTEFEQNFPIIGGILFIDIVYNYFRNRLNFDKNISFYYFRSWFLFWSNRILKEYI
jgi:hypothetical protein